MSESVEVYPSAPEIERAILGAMMLDKKAITEAVSVLGDMPDAFYKPSHMLIFKAITSMHENNLPVDQMTVADILRDRNQLDEVGGEASVASLTRETRSTANVRYHCEIIKEKAFLRMLISEMGSARNACFENTNPQQVVSSVQSVIERIHDSGKQYIRWYEDMIPEAYQRLKQWNESGAESFGIISGFPKLDTTTGGWVPGRLIIVAGKTSSGKTAFAMTCAHNAADRGKSVLYFSTEMSHEDMSIRAQSMGINSEINPVTVKNFAAGDWNNLNSTSDRLSKLPIGIVSYPGIPIMMLGNIIEQYVRTKKIELVVVDYMQQVSGSNHESRQLEVASVSRKLKYFAGKYHVPIVALSQFSRKADESDEAEPQLSWLRESGSLEQDGDQIILLWNPTDTSKTNIISKARFSTEFTVDSFRVALLKKNRFGKLKKVFVKIKEGAAFEPLDYKTEEKA